MRRWFRYRLRDKSRERLVEIGCGSEEVGGNVQTLTTDCRSD